MAEEKSDRVCDVEDGPLDGQWRTISYSEAVPELKFVSAQPKRQLPTHGTEFRATRAEWAAIFAEQLKKLSPAQGTETKAVTVEDLVKQCRSQSGSLLNSKLPPRRTCFADAPGMVFNSTFFVVFSVVLSLYFYYSDFVSDVLVAHKYFQDEHDRGAAAMDTAILSVAILCIVPTILTVVDLWSEPLKTDTTWPVALGLVLNWTNTRQAYLALRGLWRFWMLEEGYAVSLQLVGTVALLEVLLEALPQLYLQSAALGAALIDRDFTAKFSLATSVFNIGLACTVRLFAMYGWAVVDSRGYLKSTLAAFTSFVYFVSDCGSRAIVVYMRVSVHGTTMDAVGWLCLVWFLADYFIRPCALICAGTCQCGWATCWDNEKPISEQITVCRCPPSLAGVLTCLPLTVNAAERRWLFYSSTLVITTTGIWTLGSDNPSTSGSIVYLFISCCALKTIAFVIGDRVATWRLDSKQNGKFVPGGKNNGGPCCCYGRLSSCCETEACAWSETASENSRSLTEWLKYYDHATKTFGRLSNDSPKVVLSWTLPWVDESETHDSGFTFDPLRDRIQALHQFLKNLDRQDHFDRNITDDPLWTCLCFGVPGWGFPQGRPPLSWPLGWWKWGPCCPRCTDDLRIAQAQRRIERRQAQRDAINVLHVHNDCTAASSTSFRDEPSIRGMSRHDAERIVEILRTLDKLQERSIADCQKLGFMLELAGHGDMLPAFMVHPHYRKL